MTREIDFENFDFESFKKDALKKLKEGKGLSGKEGILTPFIKALIEASLEGELDAHLEEKDEPNRRNGRSTKTVKSEYGEFELNTPRDRNSTFEPQLVKKRQTILGESVDSKVISLYGLGMSYRDISEHLRDLYGLEVSDSVINAVTDRIIPEIKQWQSRPLEKLYPFIWMDAQFFKVKDESKVSAKAVYSVMAINTKGIKEILGMYIAETEGANFWLSVLTDLQNRGVEDILIASIDNLKGFKEAIESIYPKTEVQLCIVHQVRNSLKFVASKEQKIFMTDLKKVYQATTKELAEENLIDLEAKWGAKYPLVIKSWVNNWDSLSNYFKYPPAIKKIIYTTNPIESFHRQIRKVTKTKSVFSSDMALTKIWYLAMQNISKKWSMPMHNWGLTISQLAIIFEGRVELDLML
jgi:transposase-like protein